MIGWNWLQNPNHVVYGQSEDLLPRLSREFGIPGLAEQVGAFRREPAAEGVNIRGKRRTTLKLFIPNLLFSRPVEKGENVWIYAGTLTPAYCLFPSPQDARAIS